MEKINEEIISTAVEDPIIPTHEFPEEEDMQAFWNDPKSACEWMQRKYIWMTFSEYQEYWETIVDYDWPVWEYQELIDQEFVNVYTHEKKTIKVLHDIPQPDPQELIEKKIKELRLKLILWTITEEEREMLKLLVW